MKNVVKQLWIIAIAAAIAVACNDSPSSTEKGSAAIPVITVQPRGAEYNVGASAVALMVTASVNDGGTLSYQWYSNANNSNKNGTIIPDEIEVRYTPSTDDEGEVYYYVVVTNTLNGKTAGVNSDAAKITVTGSGIVIPETEYTIEISVSGNVDGDTVTASPDTGKAGDTITLTYTVADTKFHNLLDFGYFTIDSVDNAGDGTRTYTINAADASSDVITITATFTHTDLELDPIVFTETGHINKTYGDAAFNNAVVTGYSGSGAITYSSSDTTVATVNSAGQVTILKAGSAIIITAEKAADLTYAHAQANYMLTVNPKPVTITGLSAENKVYDGTTTVTVNGTAALSGKVGSDDVTVSAGTAVFNNKNVGTGKAVTFSGYSLDGVDAENYSLSAQPASVTANITAKSVTITGLSASNKVYDGTTTATVSGTATINGKISTDTVTVSAGTAAFANASVGNNKTVTFSGYSLTSTDAGNYSLSAQPASVTAGIAVKSVTITGLSAANKVYDGTTTATVTGTAVISGLVGGDAVTVSAGTAAFANATIGSGKTVTFRGWSLTGADAGNYSLAAQPSNVTANIESMIDMVPIPAGTFMMGQTSVATPVHSVTLSGFYMGKYQVTQEQYRAVMGSNPSNFKSVVAGENGTPGRLPVETVSWYDALVFCNRLSVLERLTPAYSISGSTDPAVWGTVPMGSNAIWNAVEIVAGSTGYRLPTEAQWEYACRAGTTTAYNTGDTISDNTGWYTSNSGSKTHQVGLKPANAWGLYDMHGNVWEWCWDRYGNYTSGAQNDPMGASSGANRVSRGGNYNDSAEYLRSAIRGDGDPSFRPINVGFRLVRP
jgi:formylglycine-generating enzyme required for sulfatase activity